MDNSRFYDFTNEIISETDNLFLTLKKELLPNEQYVQHDKIKYVLSRAQILYKDTIPEHLSYLRKIQAPVSAREQVEVCSEKLNKLLKDYESMKNGTMIYKQFYNIFGKDTGVPSVNNFQKGERILQIDSSENADLKP